MHRVVEKWLRGVAPVAAEGEELDTDRPQHPDMAATVRTTAVVAEAL